jgi:DNA-binding XRE family transcriptional regulator
MNKQINFKNKKSEIQACIGDIRRSKKMTQEQLGEIVGLSPKSISDIETNRRNASLLTFIKILYALNIDVKKIIFEIDK